MICPNCLEDYEFIDFDVDDETLEHRGIFRCACCEHILFPEALTKDMIQDEDLNERLRLSRLLCLRQSLTDKKKPSMSEVSHALSLKMRHLERYIEHFSEQSLRQLK